VDLIQPLRRLLGRLLLVRHTVGADNVAVVVPVRTRISFASSVVIVAPFAFALCPYK
jgi:cadmium resistance protein CadD (predicted permease)